MNKYISDDAIELLEYFKAYSLNDIFSDQDFISDYKIIHKKIFGYLVLYCEIENQNKDNTKFSQKSLFYLKESVSDILQSLFAWSNGAYKSADLLLRSSIENFNKSIIGNVRSEVFSEKSVYRIFEMASQLPEYQKKILHTSFCDTLYSVYSNLCKSVHTATNADMEHITALRLLPKYDKTDSIDYKKSVTTLVNCYLGFFLANNNEIIHKMYRTNNDVFYEVLPKNIISNIVNK